MPLTRPRANSLSIPIPTAGPWRLRRPPTPRRATWPAPENYDSPPVPPLSFWDPETPSSLPTGSPSVFYTSSPSPPSSCYSQLEDLALSPHHAHSGSPLVSPRLLLPPTLPYSILSPYSPTPPRSPPCLYLPTSPTSPNNPFLSPPLPRLNAATFFRVASPLLPASPLSIFDHAISPTSPTFLLSRTSSPGTPSWQPTFLRMATPSMAEGGAWDGSSPTFLWPRTPPALPQPPTYNGIDLSCSEAEEIERLERRCSFAGSPTMVDGVDDLKARDAERKRNQIEFYHFLAAKRASVLNRFSASPPLSAHAPTMSSMSRLAKSWKKFMPRVKVKEIQFLPGRRSRFSVWGGLGSQT